MKIKSLNEIIDFNSGFKTAVNLYLSLNKTEKVLSYIPTKSSIRLLDDYLNAVINEKEHATLLVGPYGKGKSHLLLVLLAILSMERSNKNSKTVKSLLKSISKVEEVGEKTANDIETVWGKSKFLPVIINDTRGELNQSFLVALSEALKRDGLDELVPDTYFSEAQKRIADWKESYPDTYKKFGDELKKNGLDIKRVIADLKQYSLNSLNIFEEIYPKITAGSTFNPLASSEVIPLYKSVSEKLVEDYGYAGIYIVFDEFSKFIEGLDGTNAGHTMKLLQDMCELSSESSNAQIYITMVAHKSIKEYGKYLSADIINAFTGIEGRIIEKYFVTSSKNNYELIRSALIKDDEKLKSVSSVARILSDDNCNNYYQLPAFKSNFSRKDFESIVFRGCYPLNPIAAYLLLNISEKVAQNERTLFTFISNDEPHSLARYISEHEESMGWVIGADLVYDYFSGLFKKDVSNELVHNLWLGAEYAITKCTSDEEKSLIKTIALIAMVNKNEEIAADERSLTLSVPRFDTSSAIDGLVEKQLIYKKSSIGAYVFKTKAGSELKAELKKQRELKAANCNYSIVLQQVTGKHYVVPRRYNAEMMMTRYFRHEYMLAEDFLLINDAEVFFDKNETTDGKIITIIGFDEIKQKVIQNHFKALDCPRLVLIVPDDSFTSDKFLIDYDALQGIKMDQAFINNNEVLKKEIPLLEEDIIKAIEDEVDAIYSSESVRILFWSKGKVKSERISNEEQVVNQCCRELFPKTPVINNEIINRATISTAQTRKARLIIIDAIMKHEDSEEFYSGTSQEATIYRSLFSNSIVNRDENRHIIDEIYEIINGFVDSCCDHKRSFSTLIQELTNSPFGIRLGVIPLFLARVLADRGEDLIAYFSDMEVQINPEIIVNMCEKQEEYSLFVSKTDHIKEKYISGLNRLFEVEESRALTENRIKNIVLCMQRWFRALPQISRNLTGISEYGRDKALRQQMKALKKIMQRVEINPYEVLFVDIPNEFGVDGIEDAFEALCKCKKAFDQYLKWMVEQSINSIYEIFGGQRKLDLYHLLKEWYEKQSSLSKQGLHSGGITNLMSCIEKMDAYGDDDVAQKVIKAVTNVYIENWLDDAFDGFVLELTRLKNDIENIKEENSDGKYLLSFVGGKGNTIEKYYEKANEGTGTVLRNVIEDALDEYDDLSVNDRVAILLEMIERIIG